MGAETPLVYFDGNSLGRPLKVTGPRLAEFVEGEWGGRLIRGWDEGWFDLPERIGDDLGSHRAGRRAGPDGGRRLHHRAALQADAGRGRAAARAAPRSCSTATTSRPTATSPTGSPASAGCRCAGSTSTPTPGSPPSSWRRSSGRETALVVLSHVAYRSAWLADAADADPDRPRRRGAGAVSTCATRPGPCRSQLDAWDVDLAVGCTYKYLNGGPGSPAFAYVAERLLDELTQPIQGWMGAADPFLMGPAYPPAPASAGCSAAPRRSSGCCRCRTCSTLIEEVGIDAVRAKSVALTAYAVDAGRRAAGPAGRRARLAARPGAARRPCHAHPPGDARGDRGPVGSAT